AARSILELGCGFGSFLGAGRIPTFAWLNAATGWNRTPAGYLEIGERIQTLKQAFNVKHGIEPAALRLSPRALGLPPQPKGANKGRTVDIEKLTRQYWMEFGWDPETGKPTGECMSKWGLESR
ncbi:MAG TPA: aldehyde ferredoxin oxidoreductase C-terminal domain-containing protein, partial [Syntrophales bacterium]|nr:aldehyde ferredoxin oxidoreductase C-terminal domain-containing protein [Syntrophales bacterium]